MILFSAIFEKILLPALNNKLKFTLSNRPPTSHKINNSL